MAQILILLSSLLVPVASPGAQEGEGPVVGGAQPAATQPAISTAAYRVLGMKRTKSGAL